MYPCQYKMLEGVKIVENIQHNILDYRFYCSVTDYNYCYSVHSSNCFLCNPLMSEDFILKICEQCPYNSQNN